MSKLEFETYDGGSIWPSAPLRVVEKAKKLRFHKAEDLCTSHKRSKNEAAGNCQNTARTTLDVIDEHTNFKFFAAFPDADEKPRVCAHVILSGRRDVMCICPSL